jgi:hypothetical protein
MMPPTGCPPIHHWDNYKALIEVYYLDQHHTLLELQTFFREKYQFGPRYAFSSIINKKLVLHSRAAWTPQLKSWGFMKASSIPANNLAIVELVRGYWHQNFSQKDMLRALTYDGHREVTSEELNYLRLKNNFLLRGSGRSSYFL